MNKTQFLTTIPQKWQDITNWKTILNNLFFKRFPEITTFIKNIINKNQYFLTIQ